MASENRLKLRRLGIDTYLENIIYMRADSQVCRSEGFKALTRVLVQYDGKTIVATLNVIQSDLLGTEEASLSEVAIRQLNAQEGDMVEIHHLDPVNSLQALRAKIYGHKLGEADYFAIINDIARGIYSQVQQSAFIAACSGDNRMDIQEVISLTRAMVMTGETMHWDRQPVVDKHCIGGLPGNRTTPIVVSIVAAAGLCIPKTSSRAITSPAGTADMLEVVTNVNLTTAQIRQVVEKENGCLAWGGAVRLSPVDDILIRVERALDIDSEAQLLASVLSKKVAAGSNFVVIDMPVGPTAKVRTWEDAERLKQKFIEVAAAFGLRVSVLLTDGSQPVGRGIGPSLEAMDVLSVLRQEAEAPADLRERALLLAAEILEQGGKAEKGQGHTMAEQTLASGQALNKFYAICHAQGAFREPEYASFQEFYLAPEDSVVTSINNRKLSQLAKLAGAPQNKRAGIRLFARLGEKVEKGKPLLCVYADSKGELDYTLTYLRQHPDIIQLLPKTV